MEEGNTNGFIYLLRIKKNTTTTNFLLLNLSLFYRINNFPLIRFCCCPSSICVCVFVCVEYKNYTAIYIKTKKTKFIYNIKSNSCCSQSLHNYWTKKITNTMTSTTEVKRFFGTRTGRGDLEMKKKNELIKGKNSQYCERVRERGIFFLPHYRSKKFLYYFAKLEFKRIIVNWCSDCWNCGTVSQWFESVEPEKEEMNKFFFDLNFLWRRIL